MTPVSPPAVPPHILRFSTDDLPEKDRFAYSREVYGRVLCGLEIESPADKPFHNQHSLTFLPDLHLVTGQGSEQNARRTRALLADGNDDLLLHWNTDAPGIAIQCGREARLTPGDATLFSAADIGANNFMQTTSFVTFRMPRRLLMAVTPNVEDQLARCIPAGMPALRLLKTYVDGWQNGGLAATPEMAKVFSNHVHDLIALMFGAKGDAAEQAAQGGQRAARLEQIHREIQRSALDPNFSLPRLAERLRISPSYVQKLLADEGSAFIQEVIECRLAQAQRMLRSPQWQRTSIADIALQCGFPAVHHFHALFRKRYGMTPGEARGAG
jgi:AraC-like DNA-binding protein